MSCGEIENQVLGTLFLCLILIAALISFITDFVFIGEMYNTQYWQSFTIKYKGIVASLVTFNAIIMLSTFVGINALWRSTKTISLVFLGFTLVILAILDGLAGAKLNSNEQAIFATEWDNYSDKNIEHPHYLKVWKASHAIDIFQMWIYSLGILFCIGSILGIVYGQYSKLESSQKLIQEEEEKQNIQ